MHQNTMFFVLSHFFIIQVKRSSPVYVGLLLQRRKNHNKALFFASKTGCIRPCTMGVLKEGAYQNKPSIFLSTDAYLYRRGA
jgi:hypothetical protein